MIEFENVSFSYQGQEHNGLHEINLKISDGECVLFCGRSGCGKTTITRLVNGLIPQFYQGELQGRILVDGQKISNLPMYQIASKVGSVFQNPRTQFFNVDTDSEISFGIENEALPPKELAERVDQTTDDLNIQNLRNRNIFELSGGEKQKIAFASVYAMNPEIYLLDEPSSNLDMTSIQELAGHLRLIKAQGKTVLIAEHRLYYLMDIADRIVYLDNGRITNIFTPEELRRLPQDMRERMGLRAVDLQEVLPLTCQPASGKEMLKLCDVALHYKERSILHNINISATKGEVIGVVGHNGAGKTTTLHAVTGLTPVKSGHIFFEGKDITKVPAHKIVSMGMAHVPEGRRVFAQLSVYQNLKMGAYTRKDKDEIRQTLDMVYEHFPRLEERKNQMAGTLSGGEQQMLAMGRALMSHPKIILMDEPSMGLSPIFVNEIFEIIKKVSAAGTTVLLVEQNAKKALSIADRAYVLETGKIILQGDADKLLNDESVKKAYLGE